MRIAYITAGAGRMYCGSCLRDNALAGALLRAGHDVILIPTYTPTRTDEPNVSLGRVFLGGLNIYLQQHSCFFRRLPPFLDRLFDYPPLLRSVARLGISVNPTHLGELTVSMLQGSNGRLRKEIIRLAHFLEELSPEIINLPNCLLISLAPAIRANMKAPVCCTLQGEDLFINGLSEPYRADSIGMIREHAAYVDAFIAVSRFGAQSMAGLLEIDADRIHVVPLGINFDGFETPLSGDAEPFTIGYLARIAPENGLHILGEAYRHIRAMRPLFRGRLCAAGYLGPEHKAYLARIRSELASWKLLDEFQYQGELDRPGKLKFLKGLSVFSVPETYDDPKGLFLLEAMAAGVPVVQPRRGALTEIVEKTGGGILVEPDNPEDLAQGILHLWDNPAKRTELGSQGYESVRLHYSAAQMAEEAVAVYRRLLRQ